MKISLIGNSHLGPIAAAASGDTRHETGHYISRTYGKLPLKIISKNSAVVVPEIRIEDQPHVQSVLNIDDWDAFVVVGCGYSVVRLVENWSEYQPDALPAEIGQYLVPEDLYPGYENEVMDTTQAVRIAVQLQSVTDKPIYLVPAPLPAEWVLRREGGRFESFHPFSDPQCRDYLLGRVSDQLRRLEKRGIRPIVQPGSTIDSQIWTKTEFCLGQPNDTSEKSFYSRGDFYHMNKDFGSVAWDHIQAVVTQDFELAVDRKSEDV
ncbi:hypothetical protein NicSoilE8_30360 [Arthrobacter sp. NicSoilE8]|nr:hypothetical protein NicSoilE8_30360 [Arthrobacter sp. NicSoilE8]